jgi:hypothetical protein
MALRPTLAGGLLLSRNPAANPTGTLPPEPALLLRDGSQMDRPG